MQICKNSLTIFWVLYKHLGTHLAVSCLQHACSVLTDRK